MRASTPKALASAYTRLAPVFAASLARGAYDLHVTCSRIPGGDDVTATIIFCGHPLSARHEAAMVQHAAAAIGFKLQGGIQNLMGAPPHVASWPKDGHLIVFTYKRRPPPSQPTPVRPVAEATA